MGTGWLTGACSCASGAAAAPLDRLPPGNRRVLPPRRAPSCSVARRCARSVPLSPPPPWRSRWFVPVAGSGLWLAVPLSSAALPAPSGLLVVWLLFPTRTEATTWAS
ncbi:hypothetical protein PVAP13_9KG043881 [Panicum virgatum]|uniref:Uncharacterized protein n=1 Tax=Panicum virgatum TaxID=38727 RepID=A0A8T0N606_PANVG|nr:hypothetical protein PVAP13_9KG043881 [Panicum virgatum]